MTADRAALTALAAAAVWVAACRAVVWAIDRHELKLDEMAGDEDPWRDPWRCADPLWDGT